MHRPSRRHIFLRILLPFALGYYLSYFYRVVNAVLSADLTHDLGLDAEDLGLLTASYFITFAAAQLPLGLALDRWGPRRIEAGLLLFAALGALLFALGENTPQLIVGRGLIGFGVSACLMAAFKAFTQWFDAGRLPMVNGLIMASGGLGALTATAPVQAALQFTDWRGVFLALALVTLLCAAVIFFVVPDHRGSHGHEHLADQLRGIRQVFSDRFFWRVAPLSMFSQASFISIQSLWAGPWLRDVAGLPAAEAADILLLVAGAMMAGFLGMGFLAERLGRLGVRPSTVSAAGMSLFLLTQGGILLTPDQDWLIPLWLLFGFTGTAGIIQYAALSQHFHNRLSGRANTAINLLVFVSAFTLQWLSGVLIDLWPQVSPGHYGVVSYQAAFGLLLALQTLALLWFLLPRRRGSVAA